MDRKFAVTASTTSSGPLSKLYVERRSPPPRARKESQFVLSAATGVLAIQLALGQPSLADSDSHIRMALANDPADPFSLAQRTLVSDDGDLAAAIDALMAEVPDDEWRKLPTNFAASVDEILYKRGE